MQIPNRLHNFKNSEHPLERFRWGLVICVLGGIATACGVAEAPIDRTMGAGGSSGAGGNSSGGPTTSTGGSAGTGTTGTGTTTSSMAAGGSTSGVGGAGGSPGAGGAGTGGNADAGGVRPGDGGVTPCPATGLAGAGQVQITPSGTTFTMTRDGVPFYIKGIAGGANLNLAQQYGVNSLRLYNSNNAMGNLNNAASHCMTVLLGIELSQTAADYTNPTFLAAKRTEVTNLLATVKTHRALLMWALGNEIQLGAGVDNQTTWTFVQELATTIHQQDPNHPVITALPETTTTFINHVVQWAPAIDAIGLNNYANVVTTNADVARTTFTGPIFVTEWGPTGHWEAPLTSWGRFIEDTSGAKGRLYKSRYETFAHTGRILGDYVFLWAQKIERTPTWYGMFLETNADLGIAGESLPTVDSMAFEWSGAYPVNRAPDVTALTLAGKVATDSVTLTAGQSVQAVATATEPDGDTMSYVWEILQDPMQVDTLGGPEAREPRVGTPIKGTVPTLDLTAPTVAGQYRLFVYVLDGKGHAGTANIPFLVN